MRKCLDKRFTYKTPIQLPMRRSLSLLLLAFVNCFAMAQAPQAISYQAAARDLAGNAIADQPVSVRFRVHRATANGTVVYGETHSTTTSPHGLFSLSVGLGVPESGSFSAIDWASGLHFLEVGLDTLGGSNYVLIGSQQLLSVPYALHAGNTDCMTVSLLGDTLRQGGGCFVVIPGISAANGGCGDADGDGFYALVGCPPLDCNDNDPAINPSATETCGDGLDNDCDGVADNATTGLLTWYPDADGDGYGETAAPLLVCAQPLGYILVDGDCNDSDPNIRPGVYEICDGIDNNCNGNIDDGPHQPGIFPGSVPYWIYDLDGDGVGEGLGAVQITQACTPPEAGMIIATLAIDCDENDASVYPGAIEFCDGKDNDCNGQVDDGCIACPPAGTACDDRTVCTVNDVWDGACNCISGPALVCDDGNPCTFDSCNGVSGCSFLPQSGSPCDDGDPTTLNDVCDGSGNCAGTAGCTDADLDGFFAISGCGGAVDCDDANASVHPGATEVCNGIDDDCDGQVDELFCNISGQCFAEGQVNPGVPCLICISGVSQSAWTPRPAGTACAPGNGCTLFMCDGAGVCVQSFRPAGSSCDDNNPNTFNDVCNGAGVCAGTP